MEVVNIKKKYLNKSGYKDFTDWNSKDQNVYIGRNMNFYVNGAHESKWKNPYSAKKYGRDECINMYKKYVMQNKQLMNDLVELKGKTLGCWCKPDKCHGDILVELVNKLDN